MIYELRTYYIAGGRMADQRKRFFERLPPLFERHGIQCAGKWEVSAGPGAPAFMYLMGFRDYAHREAAWGGFYVDPEWARVRAETNAGSELVESFDLAFLKRSAVWMESEVPEESASTAVHELLMHRVAAGQAQSATAYLRDAFLPVICDFGACVLGVYDLSTGANLPKIAVFLSWRDAIQREHAWKSFDADPVIGDALAAQRKASGGLAIERSDVYLLRPASL